MDLTDTDRCLRPPLGWSCSREAGHDGPCAASPAEGDDVRSTPPVGARLTGRGAAADLESIAVQQSRPLVQSIDHLEGSIARLDAEVMGLVEDLGPIIGPAAEGPSDGGRVLPDGMSPLRERVSLMHGNVENIRDRVAELRATMEV